MGGTPAGKMSYTFQGNGQLVIDMENNHGRGTVDVWLNSVHQGSTGAYSNFVLTLTVNAGDVIRIEENGGTIMRINSWTFTPGKIRDMTFKSCCSLRGLKKTSNISA